MLIKQPTYEQVTSILGQQDEKIKRHEKLLNKCKIALHYPDCWDTMAYPTIEDAIVEALYSLGCSYNECQK